MHCLAIVPYRLIECNDSAAVLMELIGCRLSNWMVVKGVDTSSGGLRTKPVYLYSICEKGLRCCAIPRASFAA
jgi:hypothetical protein